MKTKLGSKGNKVITIPPIYTYKNPIEFKNWHQQTISQISKTQKLIDADIALIDGKEMGVLVFADTLKPNLIFILSSKLDKTRFKEERKYALYSQFFFWTTPAGINNICIARPNEILLNMKFTSLISKG